MGGLTVLPPSMLGIIKRMLASMRISFRALEGVLTELLLVKAPDHTTIWKRLSKEEAEPVVPSREAIVAIDSTGFSTTLRGEWMRDHWHKHRGFVKAHIAVDVGTLDVLGVITTDERTMDKEHSRATAGPGAVTRRQHRPRARGRCVRLVRDVRLPERAWHRGWHKDA